MRTSRVILAAAAALFLSIQPAGAKDIVLGQSAPLTGSNADIGNDIRNGALAYFARVNSAGGIAGRKILLLTYDDKNDAKLAAANSEKLVHEDRVFGLFGYASATLSRPALPLVAKQKIPFIAPFTGADMMRAYSANVFNIRASYEDEIRAFLALYTNFLKAKIGVIHYDDQVGRENYQTVLRNLADYKQIEVVPIPVTRNSEEIERAANKIANSDFNDVLLTILPTPAANIIKSVRTRASGAQPGFSAISFTAASPLSRQVEPYGRGVAVSSVVPTINGGGAGVAYDYVKDLQRELPEATPTLTGLEAYIAAKVTVEALRRAGADPTPGRFMLAMEGLKSFDLGGYSVSFSSSNHNGSNYVSLLRVRGPDKFFN